MSNKQLKEISKLFSCTSSNHEDDHHNFMIDFKRNAAKIEVECDDGKTRHTWFYRGKYITHTYKRGYRGEWFEFWKVTINNPLIKKEYGSACFGCEFYIEGQKQGDCIIAKELNAERLLLEKEWSEEDMDNYHADARRDWTTIRSTCPLLLDEPLPEEKPTDRIFEENDPVSKELEAIEYVEKKDYILKVINSLNKKNLQDFSDRNRNKFVEAFDKIKVDDLKKVLWDEQLKILTDWNKKVQVVKCARPITEKDKYFSLLHLRDAIPLSERTLLHSEYGTVSAYIAYLEGVYNPATYINDDGKARYNYESVVMEWDYGAENEVTEEMMDELVEHFNGVQETEEVETEE